MRRTLVLFVLTAVCAGVGGVVTAAQAQNGYGEAPPENPSAGNVVLFEVAGNDTEGTIDAPIEPGTTVRVRVGGYGPGTDADIELHSEIVKLATVTADRGGFIDADVTIPEDTSKGRHELWVVGVDAEGRERIVKITFFVSTKTGGGDSSSAFPLALSLGALFVLVVVAGYITRRRRAAASEEPRVRTGV